MKQLSYALITFFIFSAMHCMDEKIIITTQDNESVLISQQRCNQFLYFVHHDKKAPVTLDEFLLCNNGLNAIKEKTFPQFYSKLTNTQQDLLMNGSNKLQTPQLFIALIKTHLPKEFITSHLIPHFAPQKIKHELREELIKWNAHTNNFSQITSDNVITPLTMHNPKKGYILFLHCKPKAPLFEGAPVAAHDSQTNSPFKMTNDRKYTIIIKNKSTIIVREQQGIQPNSSKIETELYTLDENKSYFTTTTVHPFLNILVASEMNDSDIKIWDLASKKLMCSLHSDNNISTCSTTQKKDITSIIEFNKTGTTMLTISSPLLIDGTIGMFLHSENTITLWDTTDIHNIKIINRTTCNTNHGLITRACFNAANDRIICLTNTNDIILLDAITGNILQRTPQTPLLSPIIKSIVPIFFPNNNLLATATTSNNNCSTELWNLRNGTSLITLPINNGSNHRVVSVQLTTHKRCIETLLRNSVTNEHTVNKTYLFNEQDEKSFKHIKDMPLEQLFLLYHLNQHYKRNHTRQSTIVQIVHMIYQDLQTPQNEDVQ